jgi:hypothetical protein
MKRKYYDLTGDVMAFKREAIGDAHVFRLPYYEGVFCDRTFGGGQVRD